MAMTCAVRLLKHYEEMGWDGWMGSIHLMRIFPPLHTHISPRDSRGGSDWELMKYNSGQPINVTYLIIVMT